MEKLPQRNLLLPNAPITPFSTTKKSKHPFKQLLSTSGMFLLITILISDALCTISYFALYLMLLVLLFDFFFSQSFFGLFFLV